jgi:hypothetical protein
MNKEEVHRAVIAHLNNRIERLQLILQDTFDAAAEDSKSSVGDKHETATAMAQLEQEKLTHQINEFLQIQEMLSKLNPSIKHSKIEPGSLIETTNGWFYLSIGLGPVKYNNSTVFCMNPLAPIGQLLKGKKAGDNIVFNDKRTAIVRVC